MDSVRCVSLALHSQPLPRLPSVPDINAMGLPRLVRHLLSHAAFIISLSKLFLSISIEASRQLESG